MEDHHNPYMLPTIVVIYVLLTTATFADYGLDGLVVMLFLPVLSVLALAVQPLIVSLTDWMAERIASLFSV